MSEFKFIDRLATQFVVITQSVRRRAFKDGGGTHVRDHLSGPFKQRRMAERFAVRSIGGHTVAARVVTALDFFLGAHPITDVVTIADRCRVVGVAYDQGAEFLGMSQEGRAPHVEAAMGKADSGESKREGLRINPTGRDVGFFRAHGGFCQEKGETEEEARLRCARRLAAAERWLDSRRHAVRWEEDPHADRSHLASDDGRPIFWCSLEVDCPACGEKTGGSLGGIDLGPSPRGDEPYKRVVVAELAVELQARLDG